MFLSALATLNFSLSFLVGVLAAPLSFVRARPPHIAINVFLIVLLSLMNPLVVIYGVTRYFRADFVGVLVQAAEGWHVWGMWTQVVLWLVWWPAWFAGVVIVSLGLHQN
jgi:GPI-anchor transamidase subunit GAA1